MGPSYKNGAKYGGRVKPLSELYREDALWDKNPQTLDTKVLKFIFIPINL